MSTITTVAGTISASFAPSIKQQVSDIDLETVALAISPKITWSTGSANTVTPSLTKLDEVKALAQEVFGKVYTIAPSGTQTIDLSGVLVDALGNTITPASVKALVVSNRSVDCSLVFGNAASNGWYGPFGASTHTLKLRPKGWVILAAPGGEMTVTAGTGDQLLMTAGNEGTSGVSVAIGFIFG